MDFVNFTYMTARLPPGNAAIAYTETPAKERPPDTGQLPASQQVSTKL